MSRWEGPAGRLESLRGMLWTGRGGRDEAHGGDREGGPYRKHTAPEGGGRAHWALTTGPPVCTSPGRDASGRPMTDPPADWVIEESSENRKNRKTTQNKTGVGREKHQSRGGHKLPTHRSSSTEKGAMTRAWPFSGTFVPRVTRSHPKSGKPSGLLPTSGKRNLRQSNQ